MMVAVLRIPWRVQLFPTRLWFIGSGVFVWEQGPWRCCSSCERSQMFPEGAAFRAGSKLRAPMILGQHTWWVGPSAA